MNKNTSHENEKSTLELIREFASGLLENGVRAGDVSFYLTAAGVELAFISAPSPEHALAVISSAQLQVSKSRLPEADEEEAETTESVSELEPEFNSTESVDGQTIH